MRALAGVFCTVSLVLALNACTSPAAAHHPATGHTAGTSLHVAVYDRTSGKRLPVYRHAGRYYVAGQPGHRYRIELSNGGAARTMAVVSVDGVNVLTGETADPQQAGYVLDPGQRFGVAGWRKSLDEVAAFYFTALPRSYAARTGRPNDVGVIGVAVFHERPMLLQEAPAAAAPMASKRAHAESAMADRLGTGHGERQTSRVVRTHFERDSDAPAEVITLYYDSRDNLIAQGIIPNGFAHAHPRPFPKQEAGFVPDPPRY